MPPQQAWRAEPQPKKSYLGAYGLMEFFLEGFGLTWDLILPSSFPFITFGMVMSILLDLICKCFVAGQMYSLLKTSQILEFVLGAIKAFGFSSN